MTEAKKDQNSIPVTLGTSDADGITPLPIQADPSTHELYTDDNTTGSDLSDDIARRDNNGQTVLMATSSTDGITPVPVYIDSVAGKFLINSM